MPGRETDQSAGSNEILGREKHVGVLFAEAFYQVPEFQREYAWEADVHFTAMLADFLGQYSPNPSEWDEYFLGNLVVWKRDEKLQLIDGQQRMTALTILLCAIRDRFVVLNDAEGAAAVNNLLRSNRREFDPVTRQWSVLLDPRVELLYADARGALADLIGERAAIRLQADAESTSVYNIVESYKEATNFIEANMGSVDLLTGFLEYITQKVTLVLVKAPDDSHAISIFWTMNDRGRQLDALELLKNLLFAATPRRVDWGVLAEKWKVLRQVLDSAEVTKPVQFLRYAVLSSYNAAERDDDWKKTKEDNIHRWMKDHSQELGIDADPLAYADALISVAKRYKRLKDDKRPNGTESLILPNFKKFSKGMRQHYVVLLAAHGLPDQSFDRVASTLENLLFVILFVGSITREVEREFTKWAAKVRAASDAPDPAAAVEEFIEQELRPEIRRRAGQFDARFRSATSDDITETRYKYAVAKIAQHVDAMCHDNRRPGDPAPHERLSYFINRSHDLEHILPKRVTDEWKTQFGTPEEQERINDYIWNFGNLTYLESSINSQVQRSLFPAKRMRYPESKFELTKALATLPVGSQRRQELAAILKYNYSAKERWTATDIEARKEVMLRLAHMTWDLGEYREPAPQPRVDAPTAAP